jgi:hypothetical protein
MIQSYIVFFVLAVCVFLEGCLVVYTGSQAIQIKKEPTNKILHEKQLRSAIMAILMFFAIIKLLMEINFLTASTLTQTAIVALQ